MLARPQAQQAAQVFLAVPVATVRGMTAAAWVVTAVMMVALQMWMTHVGTEHLQWWALCWQPWTAQLMWWRYTVLRLLLAGCPPCSYRARPCMASLLLAVQHQQHLAQRKRSWSSRTKSGSSKCSSKSNNKGTLKVEEVSSSYTWSHPRMGKPALHQASLVALGQVQPAAGS